MSTTVITFHHGDAADVVYTATPATDPTEIVVTKEGAVVGSHPYTPRAWTSLTAKHQAWEG